jgi:hypothetical protein
MIMKKIYTIFVVVAGIFLNGCCTSTRSQTPEAIQINISSLLNARVIFTEHAGRLQPADHGLDHGAGSVLITESAAKLAKSGELNSLPDSGLFPANTEHPDVQLPYGIVGGGPQVHQSTDTTETYFITIPTNHYSQMQLFFISAAGPTPISVKLQYVDGSSEERTTTVPDFYFLPKATDIGWFVLANDFGKVDLKGKMTEKTHHYILGFNLNPDSAKVLRQIEITKLDSKSVLNLFGATGTLKTH